MHSLESVLNSQFIHCELFSINLPLSTLERRFTVFQTWQTGLHLQLKRITPSHPKYSSMYCFAPINEHFDFFSLEFLQKMEIIFYSAKKLSQLIIQKNVQYNWDNRPNWLKHGNNWFKNKAICIRMRFRYHRETNEIELGQCWMSLGVRINPRCINPCSKVR